MFKFYSLLSVLALVLSCTKEKNFNVDLFVKSKYSGQGLSGKVYLEYTKNGEHTINLGDLLDGRLNVIADIPRSVDYGELKIYIDGIFFSIPGTDFPSGKTSIRRGDGPISLELMPVSRMEFTLVNSNCFDSTDSVWVNFLNSPLYTPKLFTGCMNSNPGGLPIWFQGSILNFETISKKNGMYDTIQHQFQVTPEIINQFSIHY